MDVRRPLRLGFCDETEDGGGCSWDRWKLENTCSASLISTRFCCTWWNLIHSFLQSHCHQKNLMAFISSLLLCIPVLHCPILCVSFHRIYNFIPLQVASLQSGNVTLSFLTRSSFAPKHCEWSSNTSPLRLQGRFSPSLTTLWMLPVFQHALHFGLISLFVLLYCRDEEQCLGTREYVLSVSCKIRENLLSWKWNNVEFKTHFDWQLFCIFVQPSVQAKVSTPM